MLFKYISRLKMELLIRETKKYIEFSLASVVVEENEGHKASECPNLSEKKNDEITFRILEGNMNHN